MAEATLHLPNGPVTLNIPECKTPAELYTFVLACWLRHFPSVWPEDVGFIQLSEDHMWKPTRAAMDTLRRVLQEGGLISCARGRPTAMLHRIVSVASLFCPEMQRPWPDPPAVDDLVDGESFSEWEARVRQEEEDE